MILEDLEILISDQTELQNKNVKGKFNVMYRPCISTFFIYYLAAPQSILGHCWGGSLTMPSEFDTF